MKACGITNTCYTVQLTEFLRIERRQSFIRSYGNEKYNKRTLGNFSVWLIATILLTAFQPDFNAILRLKGQQALDKNSQSIMADSILSKMDASKGTNDIIVFYDKNKLSDEEIA